MSCRCYFKLAQSFRWYGDKELQASELETKRMDSSGSKRARDTDAGEVGVYSDTGDVVVEWDRAHPVWGIPNRWDTVNATGAGKKHLEEKSGGGAKERIGGKLTQLTLLIMKTDGDLAEGSIIRSARFELDVG